MSKTLKEQIEVMQHYVNGGMIEIYSKGTNTWNLVSNPSFDWANSDYRIKEQKKTITIEKWLISYEDNVYQILLGNEKFFKKNIHPQSKIKLLETYEVEL